MELIGRICADRSTRESVTSATSAGSAFGSVVENEPHALSKFFAMTMRWIKLTNAEQW